MNKTQKENLFDIFEEEILNDEYTRANGPFTFKVYSSDGSEKIVIQCIADNSLIMFYTIDYAKQQYLPECCGINGDEESFFLNCEMKRYSPKIFYTINELLTKEFNERYK